MEGTETLHKHKHIQGNYKLLKLQCQLYTYILECVKFWVHHFSRTQCTDR